MVCQIGNFGTGSMKYKPFFILNFTIANTVISKKSYFRLNICWDVICPGRFYNLVIWSWWCTSCYTGRWRCWSGLHGHPLQQGSNWHRSWTSWQATPEEEALGYHWDPWSLWPKTRPEEKKRGEPEGAKDFREIKRKIRTEMKMAKETWIQVQCQEVEACLRKYNNKNAYQLVKDLTIEKQDKSTTIQDKVKDKQWSGTDTIRSHILPSKQKGK